MTLFGFRSALNGICKTIWPEHCVTGSCEALLMCKTVRVLQCVTCNMCGCGSLLDFIFSAAACAWWAAASLVFGKYATEANKAELPEAEWRGWIIIVAWVQAGLFVIIAGISLIRCDSAPGCTVSTFGCSKARGLRVSSNPSS